MSYTSLFMLFVFLPSVFCGLDPSCIVSQSSVRAYLGFDFRHKTTVNTSATETVKYARHNNMFFQLVAYENDKYGHHVSFSEDNQTRYFNNNTLVRYVYSGFYCQSSSYQPKELNRLWLKSFTGSTPFSLEANETSKNLTASVTLKCNTPYCTVYDLLTNEYTDCSDSSPNHDSIGIKASLVVTPLYQDYAYSNLCFSQYTASNGTYACTYPYLSGYENTNTNLNVSLVNVASNTKPNKQKTLLRANYLKDSYATLNTFAQLYSVCSEDCQALSP